MILGSGWPCALLLLREALRSLDAEHLFYYPLSCKRTQPKRGPICDIPRAQDMIQDDSGAQRPASPRVGSIYPSMCDSTPSGTAHWHQFVSAVGSQP